MFLYNTMIFKVFFTEMGTVLLAWFFPKARENPPRSVRVHSLHHSKDLRVEIINRGL